jgi:hypothetical protein
MRGEVNVKRLFETFNHCFRALSWRSGTKTVLDRESICQLQQFPISQDFDLPVPFCHAKNQPMDERAGSRNFVLNS